MGKAFAFMQPTQVRFPTAHKVPLVSPGVNSGTMPVILKSTTSSPNRCDLLYADIHVRFYKLSDKQLKCGYPTLEVTVESNVRHSSANSNPQVLSPTNDPVSKMYIVSRQIIKVYSRRIRTKPKHVWLKAVSYTTHHAYT